jgi:hypothetical protein
MRKIMGLNESELDLSKVDNPNAYTDDIINHNADRGGDDFEGELVEFIVPNWALSALINSDESGLTDEDREKLNAFVNDVVSQYGNANFMLPGEGEMELGFLRSNDIDNLGSDCSRLLINPSAGVDESELDLSKVDNPNAYTDDIINHNADRGGDDFDEDSVRISMLVMSALSDMQEENPELRKKINYVKSLIMKMNDKTEIKMSDLDAIEGITEGNDFDFEKAAIESASGDKVVQREFDDYDRPLYYSINDDNISYFIGDGENGKAIFKYNAKTGENKQIGDLKSYDEPKN